jgi:hypothetical protein
MKSGKDNALQAQIHLAVTSNVLERFRNLQRPTTMVFIYGLVPETSDKRSRREKAP